MPAWVRTAGGRREDGTKRGEVTVFGRVEASVGNLGSDAGVVDSSSAWSDGGWRSSPYVAWMSVTAGQAELHRRSSPLRLGG